MHADGPTGICIDRLGSVAWLFDDSRYSLRRSTGNQRSRTMSAGRDGRAFDFERVLDASRDVVWRYWSDPDLLASWWAPPSMTVTDCVLEPRPGGRAVLEYRDAEGTYRSEGRVSAAKRPGHLVFDLSVLDAAGAVAFTGHYDLTLSPDSAGTRLRLDLTITETTIPAVAFIAGIETGWGRVLDQLVDIVGAANIATSTRTEGK